MTSGSVINVCVRCVLPVPLSRKRLSSFHLSPVPSVTPVVYCNRTNFRTRFIFVYFVLLVESTKFSSTRKPYTYTSVSDTTVAVRKFLAYESRQTLEYEIFTCMKISAITVCWVFLTLCNVDLFSLFLVSDEAERWNVRRKKKNKKKKRFQWQTTHSEVVNIITNLTDCRER